MFKNTFIELCNQKGVSPTSVCLSIGLSNAAYSNWTDKTIPRDATLRKIADYFNVTVDYLLGKTEKPADHGELTEHEAKVLNAYRKQPEMQPAVDRLLGITDDEYVLLYTAASSNDNRPDRIIKMSKEKWDKIKNTPDTDDKLI